MNEKGSVRASFLKENDIFLIGKMQRYRSASRGTAPDMCQGGTSRLGYATVGKGTILDTLQAGP